MNLALGAELAAQRHAELLAAAEAARRVRLARMPGARLFLEKARREGRTR